VAGREIVSSGCTCRLSSALSRIIRDVDRTVDFASLGIERRRSAPFERSQSREHTIYNTAVQFLALGEALAGRRTAATRKPVGRQVRPWVRWPLPTPARPSRTNEPGQPSPVDEVVKESSARSALPPGESAMSCGSRRGGLRRHLAAPPTPRRPMPPRSRLSNKLIEARQVVRLVWSSSTGRTCAFLGIGVRSRGRPSSCRLAHAV